MKNIMLPSFQKYSKSVCSSRDIEGHDKTWSLSGIGETASRSHRFGLFSQAFAVSFREKSCKNGGVLEKANSFKIVGHLNLCIHFWSFLGNLMGVICTTTTIIGHPGVMIPIHYNWMIITPGCWCLLLLGRVSGRMLINHVSEYISVQLESGKYPPGN